MKKVELKPCPFCGSEAELSNTIIDKHAFGKIDYIREYYIQCYGCLVKTRRYLNKEIAIEKWNARVNDEKR